VAASLLLLVKGAPMGEKGYFESEGPRTEKVTQVPDGYVMPL